MWWHGHPDWLPRGRRGPYWDAKISRNVERDRRVDADLAANSWRVLRLWDLEVLADPAELSDETGTNLILSLQKQLLEAAS